MKLIATSSQGPSTAQWGDFIAVTAFQPTGLTWVVSSFGLQGCGTDGACVKPFIAYFGRERDRQSFATWFRYVYSVYLPALTR
jgi:hypothetical protein